MLLPPYALIHFGYQFYTLSKTSSQGEVLKATKSRVLRSDNFFKDSFFPAVISEWNSLDTNIRNFSINVFKKELLNFIRPDPNSTYNINGTKGLKLLTRLRLGLSHLGDHKFRHNFQDCVSPMCSYGQEIETTTHFLFHCLNHHCARKTLFHKINQVSGAISSQWCNNYKDFPIRWQKLRFWNKILLKPTIEFLSLT